LFQGWFDEFWLLLAFNAELLLSVLHVAGLMLIVTCYSRAKFLRGIVCCAVASVSFLCFSCFAIGGI
jgi:hypothetical protein